MNYPVSAIPENLKNGADVVVREDFMRFKILSKNHARHYVRYVATIMNEKGKGHAEYQIFYDKYIKVVDINGAVYDAQGKQVKKIRNKDISDVVAFDGVSLFSDNRLKVMDLTQAIYPYTVEIDYELEYNFLFDIPESSWSGRRVSYQAASYELSYPIGFPVTYKLINLNNAAPTKKSEGGFATLTWKFENLEPLVQEPYGPPASELSRMLVVVPNEFDFAGYEGKRDTWENFGKWQIELNKGRDILPEKTIALAKVLVKNATTTEEKAKILYEYIQSRTRYVGIQLGIGGFQPFEAKVVDQVGYGDCKALSNYMISLLKAVGIRGYYTWIYGGTNGRRLVDGITRDVFNHIVVAIPNDKDTLWLECTSQTDPFGYQGKFTGDRKALMITDNGGVLVNTLRYSADQNKQWRTADVTVDAKGDAKAKITTTASAIQYENGGLNFMFANADRQKKWVEEHTQIPNFTINSFSIQERRSKLPSAVINLDLTLSRYASVSGKRLFIPPNLMNRNTFNPPKMAERKMEVVTNENYVDLDTINISIPESLYPEFIPEPIVINSKFGEYEANFKFDAGKVTYIRRMKVWKSRLPKETYNELVEFYKNVTKADNIKLVFLNKT